MSLRPHIDLESRIFNPTEERQNLSRRDFARSARDAIAALLLLSAPGCRKSSTTGKTAAGEKSRAETAPALTFFTPDEAAAVEAISSRIIPTSSGSPGARDAGVVYFIDYMLAEAYKTSQPIYREALGNLNEVSQKRFGRVFINISETEQDSILEMMERGAIEEWQQAGQFFSTVRAHTIEGMFSDPRYHGNYGQTGWTLLGDAH